MDARTLSYQLRRIRNAKGLSQGKAAEAAGLSRPAYAKIETGDVVPKVSTLMNIARGLDVALQELVSPVELLTAVRFRSLKRMTRREQILADVSRWLKEFNSLEEMLDDRLAYRFAGADPTHGVDPTQRTERAERASIVARAARKALDLTQEEPIRDICGLLESNGIKVYPMEVASDAFFGLSVAPREGGPAVVVNVWDRISVERRIFTAAHELGHLLLHLNAYDVEWSEEDETEEREADHFADYFLMPDELFLKEWKETYGLPLLDRVLKVKRIFRVSYRTVLYRLSVDPAVGGKVWPLFASSFHRRFGKRLSAKDEPEPLVQEQFQACAPEWKRSREPGHLAPSDFFEDRLSKLVRCAIEEELISVSRGAEILRVSHGEMRERMECWV